METQINIGNYNYDFEIDVIHSVPVWIEGTIGDMPSNYILDEDSLEIEKINIGHKYILFYNLKKENKDRIKSILIRKLEE